MSQWSEKQIADLEQLLTKASKDGKTGEYYEEISQKTGHSVNETISEAASRKLPALHYDLSPLIQQCIDIAPRNMFIGPAQFESVKATVASDLHAPAVSWEAFEQLMRRGAGSDLFHVGDALNNEGFSPFRDSVGASFGEDMDVLEHIIQYWDKYFNSVTVSLGNHDDAWLRRATDGQITLPQFVKRIRGKNIQVVDSTHMLLNKDWFLCHPKEYSRNPLVVATKLANKWERNVACGHSHAVGWGTSPAGHIVVDMGGLMNEEEIVYSNYNSASNAFWSQGFLTINGPQWHLYSNRNNWEG